MDESLKNRALKILEDEQDQLDGAYDKQTDVEIPTKIEKVNVTQDASGRWSKNTTEEDSGLYDENVIGQLEQQIEKDAKTLQEFCVEPDNAIISFNIQINNLKTQIATLSAQATSGNCWPGIANTLGDGSCNGDPIDYATYTTINQDRDGLKIFEPMAGPNVNYSASNPFDPDSIVTLTTFYAGHGYENVKQDNGGSLITSQGRFDISTNPSDHNAGGGHVCYTGSTISPATCVSIANSIAALQAQIVSLRSQRDAAVNRTNLNAVKSVKKEKELQNWGIKNLQKRVAARKTKNTSAISAVQSFS